MITFDDIDRLVELSQQPIDNDWLDAYYSLYEAQVSTRLNYYRFLYHLVALRKPSIALELGTEFGVASAHMVAAASSYDGHVIGMDINWHGGPGGQIPDKYPNYNFWPQDSISCLSSMYIHTQVDKYGSIGVVFQDSSHHYAESVAEWKLYGQLLDANAVWVCDDITEAFFEAGVDEKSMVGYWDELPGRKKLYPDVLHKGNAIGVMLI